MSRSPRKNSLESSVQQTERTSLQKSAKNERIQDTKNVAPQPAKNTPQQAANNTGKRLVIARRLTLSLVFVAVIASLAFDTGFGTPSAFGIGEFFLLCPLGGLEAMLASKSFLPAAAISLAVLLLLSLIFGRAWCAWGCPAPSIRKFFKREAPKDSTLESSPSEETSTQSRACSQDSCSSCKTDNPTQSHVSSLKSMLSFYASDKRVWVLAGVLIITFAIGLPLFCLICPIGLTFGSVSSLWHLIIDKQITASVIVFPLCLIVELVIYRKWCLNLCPIGGLLGIFGSFAKLFRPRIKTASCLRYQEDKAACNTCVRVCPENINMHTEEAALSLANCSRCGECVAQCPTGSISIEAKPQPPLN